MTKKVRRSIKIAVLIVLSLVASLIILPAAKPSNVIVPAVYQILSDYQYDAMGGNGWLRLYTFKPAEDRILVRTYSPFLSKWETDANSEFNLPISLNGTIDYTIVVLPDTQHYSSSYPEIFTQQTEWIVANKVTYNIVFVIHLGDIVDNYLDASQWTDAKSAMTKLTLAGIPYTALPGNHDFESSIPTTKAPFENWFGSTHYNGQPWYGGSFDIDDHANNYCYLDMGAEKYLLLSLQYNPDASMLAWANMVIDNNPDFKIIIATHEYLQQESWVVARSAIGATVWQSLVKPHNDQVFLVLCGHFAREALLTDYIDPSLFFLWWLQ